MRSNERSNGEICSRTIREQIGDWKTMIVSKLMYRCGVLAWYQRECDNLEVIQNGFSRWLCDVGNVRNEQVRAESGWSLFTEREVTCIADSVCRKLGI